MFEWEKKLKRLRTKKRTQERIQRLNNMPNFLTVVETKDEKTKKFLEDIEYQEHNTWKEIKDGGIIIEKQRRRDGTVAVKRIMTVEEYIRELVEDMK